MVIKEWFMNLFFILNVPSSLCSCVLLLVLVTGKGSNSDKFQNVWLWNKLNSILNKKSIKNQSTRTIGYQLYLQSIKSPPQLKKELSEGFLKKKTAGRCQNWKGNFTACTTGSFKHMSSFCKRCVWSGKLSFAKILLGSVALPVI